MQVSDERSHCKEAACLVRRETLALARLPLPSHSPVAKQCCRCAIPPACEGNYTKLEYVHFVSSDLLFLELPWIPRSKIGLDATGLRNSVKVVNAGIRSPTGPAEARYRL